MTRIEFASMLKEFRTRENLTQQAAATYLGVSLRTWQNWEIARNMPRGFGLCALILALENASPSRNKASHSTPAGARKHRAKKQNYGEAPPALPTAESERSAPTSLDSHLL